MKYAIDLHVHTNASNKGVCSHVDIVAHAISKGVRTIAITDRHTCEGVIKAMNYADILDLHINILPGIELDCLYHNTHLYLLGYGINPYSTAFFEIKKYMLDNQHHPQEWLSLTQAIAMIQYAGGVPIVSHPEHSIHRNLFMLKEMISMGVAGIEAVNSYHTPEQSSFYLDLAKQLNILVTCGTNFNGKATSKVQLGVYPCEIEPSIYYNHLIRACHVNHDGHVA